MDTNLRLKQLFHNANQSIIEISLSGRIRYLNKHAENLLGVSEHSITGMYVWEFMKHKQKGFDEFVKKYTQNDHPTSENAVQIVSQGIHSIWVDATVSPFSLRNDDKGYLIFLKDITRKKIAEERAKSTKEYLTNILNDSADGILGISMNNRILLWNKGAELIYGYTSEEMLGQPITRLIPDFIDSAKEVKTITDACLSKGYLRNFVTQRLTKDNKIIKVNITRSLFKDFTGKILGFSAIVRDITEQENMQSQLLKAERLSIVGKMAAQVAHEIRNPLSSIMLNLELIEDEMDEVDEKIRKEICSNVQTINKEVEHLNNLTDDYLSFVRMPELKREVVNINHVIHDVLKFYKPTLDEQDVTVEFVNNKNLTVSIDINQIKRAVLNIVKNGVEAMEDRRNLKCWCSMAKGNSMLSINIKDSGTGIDSQSMDKLLEPFYTTKLTGSGLGMHITSQILKEHNGHLKIHSVPGKGTLVRILLPADTPIHSKTH